MNRIQVRICMGTACYVMGSAQLQRLAEVLDDDLLGAVDIEGVRCLGFCQTASHGRPPFVTVGEECIADADMETVLEALRRQLGKTQKEGA